MFKGISLILLAAFLCSGFITAQENSKFSPRQDEFLSWKFGMFIHFSMATYHERHQYSNRYTESDWLEIKQHIKTLQPDWLVIANNSLDFKKTDIRTPTVVMCK